jgi:hypothetical protein
MNILPLCDYVDSSVSDLALVGFFMVMALLWTVVENILKKKEKENNGTNSR